jgi:hypothetical protein
LDHDAYRAAATQAALDKLRFDVSKAIENERAQFAPGVDLDYKDDGVNFRIQDATHDGGVAQKALSKFSGRTDVAISDAPALAISIGFAPTSAGTARPDPMQRALAELRLFVLHARTPIPGVEVERVSDGVLVHLNDPARRAELAGRLRRRFPNDGWIKATGPDEMIRVVIDKEAVERLFPGPAGVVRRLILPEGLTIDIRDLLTDPDEGPTGVEVNTSANTLELVLADPQHHADYTQALRDVFLHDPAFVFTQTEGRLIGVKVTPSPPDSPTQRPPAGVQAVWHESASLIGPPPATAFDDVKIEDASVIVQADDPDRMAKEAKAVRISLAGRSDLVLTDEPNQGLRVTLASGTLAVREPSAAEIAQNLRASLAALRVSAHLTPLAGERIAVRVWSTADAAQFRRMARGLGGFSMQLVDDAVPKSDQAPSPNDTRAEDPQSGRALWLRPDPFITGDMIATAAPGYDVQGKPAVTFRLTAEGARRFAAVTSANVGRRIAMLVDGKVVSAPTVQEPITGGAGMIAGVFTEEEVQDLAFRVVANRTQTPLRIFAERPR